MQRESQVRQGSACGLSNGHSEERRAIFQELEELDTRASMMNTKPGEVNRSSRNASGHALKLY